MKDIRTSFSKVGALVIGDVMLDRYWWGDVSRISPEAPVPVVHLRRQTCTPGGAANVACNIAGLGAEAFLVGCVGADSDAAAFRAALREVGGSDDHLIERNDVPTSVKTRIIAHSQQVVRVDQERAENLSATVEQEICSRISNLMPTVDIVVVSDYQKGTLTPAVLQHIFETAREHSKKVIVDPKGKDFSKYAGATMITPNRREAAEASQLEESDAAFIETVGKQIIETLGFEAVLITRSEEGMSLFVHGSDEVHLQAHTKEIYDVTGAGDTVIATLAVALAGGHSYAEASEIANIAAGIVVEQIGTSTITMAQLYPAVEASNSINSIG
ncbi:MAG: D-glycero-beta-D-manno-heptose-7-phosphate kinase [Acidobacteriota bacterium]